MCGNRYLVASYVQSSTIRIRIPEALEREFKEICDIQGANQSQVLRWLITRYVESHPKASHNLDVNFEYAEYPENNPHSKFCYYITATLSGKLDDINEEIIFVLPEFFHNRVEPYRVDSNHRFRKAIPGAYGADRFDGRVLGAKFIDGRWEGVIIIYDESLIDHPKTNCFPHIEKELRNNILNAVSGLLAFPARKDSMDAPLQ